MKLLYVATLLLMTLEIGLACASTPSSSVTKFEKRDGPSEESIAKAKSILATTPVIDGHNDFVAGLRTLLKNNLNGFNFNTNLSESEPWTSYFADHTDLVRMRAGHVGGQFWSVWVTCDSQYKDTVQKYLEQIDMVKRLVTAYSNHMTFVTSAAGIEKAFVAGKVASLIGMESGHGLASSLGVLRMYYELGVRYVTLTHDCNTPWADASQVELGELPVRNGGLSDFGIDVVLEMNRLGMMVDLSHVSHETMTQVMTVTQAPIIFSHSSVRGVCDRPRNVPDDILKQLPNNGGIVNIEFYPYFLNCECDSTAHCYADVHNIVAHINHVRKVAGIDHVGLGSDFSGIEVTPRDVTDVSHFPLIFAALLEDTEFEWTQEDLEKVASKNIIRVLKQVEQVRDELLVAQEEPFQMWIPKEDFHKEELICTSEET